MHEKELVRHAQAGDFEAFNQLIQNHKRRIYALAIKMTGNEQDAEDIVQETLLKAIDNIDQFRGEASFGTWLYSIALNESRGQLSDRRQVDLKPIEVYLPQSGDSEMHKETSTRLFDWKDPHKLLEDRELKKIINTAINELPAKYKEAFLLRYIDELSIKEIAEITHESVASVKSRVLRAKLAVRDSLAHIFEASYGQKM